MSLQPFTGFHNEAPLLKDTDSSEPQRENKNGEWYVVTAMGMCCAVDGSQGNSGSVTHFDMDWEMLTQKGHYTSRDGTWGTDTERQGRNWVDSKDSLFCCIMMQT